MANRFFRSAIDLVVFGATGDLMARKILPSLFYLYKERKLSDNFKIVGVSRRDISEEEFKNRMREAARRFPDIKENRRFNSFLRLFYFIRGYFGDKYTYEDLKRIFDPKAKHFFYLAVAPKFYRIVLRNLADANLINPRTHIILEKPTGLDFKSALEIEKLLGRYFKAAQIYRVDHYLAKDGLEKLYDFRFIDGSMEKIWNREYISKIELRLLEKKDVAGRGEFYDDVGALRDVGQNHLLSMLAYVAMERGEIHDARAQVIKLLKIKNGYRAQYRGYRDERGVKKNSKVETFFRINAYLRGGRLKNVPILIEAGKAMPEDRKEVMITFNDRRKLVFPMETHRARYQYVEEYKKILVGAFAGNASLFLCKDEMLAAWKFVDPIVLSFKKNLTPLRFYNQNTYPKI